VARITTFTFEQLAVLIQEELQKSYLLQYVPDEAIIISSTNERDTIPQFQNYLIKIYAPDSGFIEKQPKIGRYYRNYYYVAIELWIKSGSGLTDRLLTGSIGTNKGIYEFFQDVSDTLEHNTFEGELDPLPGTSILTPTTLASEEKVVEGIGFIWVGNQDNIK
jgi:hypothetical protein